MMHGKMAILLAMAATALVIAGMAMGQTSRPARNPDGTWAPIDTNSPEYKAAVENRRKEVSKAYQDILGATDEEWKVLEPKFEKVNDLSIQIKNAAYIVNWPVDALPDASSQTDMQKTALALGKLLKNKDIKPEDMKKALEAYRNAKTKANEDLDKARKELKDLLTVKQEATLVLRGLLD